MRGREVPPIILQSVTSCCDPSAPENHHVVSPHSSIWCRSRPQTIPTTAQRVTVPKSNESCLNFPRQRDLPKAFCGFGFRCAA